MSTTTSHTGAASRSGTLTTGLLLDVVLVVLFATLGRSTHEHGLGPAQVVSTAWPFLAGAGLGWLVARGWSSPWSLRTGLLAWLGSWAAGMGLRALTGQGTATAFIVVAGVFLLVLPGWRLLARAVSRRRSPA